MVKLTMTARLIAAVVWVIFAATSASAAEEEKCSSNIAEADFSWAPDPASGLSLWGDEESDWAFLFLGSFHSFDPNERFVGEIRRFFAQFRPTLVIYEGHPLERIKGAVDSILRGGEMGFAQWLAESCRIKHKTFEPSFAREVALLSKKFAHEDLKLYYVARLIPQYNAQNPPTSLERYLFAPFERGGDMNVASLQGTKPTSLDELGVALKAVLPQVDARRLEYKHVAPIGRFNTQEKGLLNQIATESSRIREDALEIELRAALLNRERVFVIAGTPHMLGVRQRLNLDEYRPVKRTKN